MVSCCAPMTRAWHVDRRQFLRPVPSRQAGVGADAQLAGPLHGHVDRRVDVGEGAHHRVRPVRNRHPQHVVDVVLLVQQLHVPGVLDVAAGLERLDLGQRAGVHGRHQHLLGVGVVGRDAGHHVGDHHPAQVLLVVQRVLDGQQPAPRLPVQHESGPVEPERPADLLHLVDEAVQVPQRRLLRLVAKTGPELVVVVVLDPRAGQVTVAGLQVLVRRPRPAVQEQHPQPRVVAGALHPHPVRSLRRVHRDHPGASAQRVLPAGIVQIPVHGSPPEASPAPDRIMPVPSGVLPQE